ncbi:OmpA family protein [Vibrio barjaei]|uniref:OmpA family protein n=1 Tax=Vibrio barjaei TaxID=1676683 RepID=UPI00228499C8|nr:OmpA family protein [Vibrio barjaei]MCY9872309.1 OmpA family protein [Vibrio barjaei]
MTCFRKILWLGLGCVSGPSLAENNISRTDWYVDADVYSCKLIAEDSQSNMSLTLVRRAGQSLAAEVESKGFNDVRQYEHLGVVGPFWSSDISDFSTAGSLSYKSHKFAFVENVHPRFLELLKDGKTLGLVGDGQLLFSPINIQQLEADFEACISVLPSKTYSAVKSTEVIFRSPKLSDAITDAVGKRLDDIVSVIKSDKSITKVLVDGHTDSTGDVVNNLELSHKRASLIAMALVERGVPVGKIKKRGHGQRYPKYSNNTEDGRIKNRRVTIQLVKE